MKIKVCGLTSGEQIRAVADAGADYGGLIFYEKSPRYCVDRISQKDLPGQSDGITLTGVFVNASTDQILRHMDAFHLSAVQLCGEETPAQCEKLKNHVAVIKVIHLSDSTTADHLTSYAQSADYLLFDTPSPRYGGTGKKFDWSRLYRMDLSMLFFLSGGIDAGDVTQIHALKMPFLYGVDINSRFETAPGIKDIEKIKLFIEQCKIQ